MPKQILLVDDSVTIHRVVEITFAQEDYALTIAKTAEEGIEKAKQLRPDLVLVDATLGNKTGYDIVTAIRQEGSLAKTACLLLTGNFSPYDEAKGSAAGADGFVVKPFETQAMIDKAKDAIARRAGGEVPAAVTTSVPALTPVAAAAPAAQKPGVESLSKPLSTVAAETSARISAQPAAKPVGAAPIAARPAPKATLMGIPAVNPANLVPPAAKPAPITPPPAAVAPTPIAPPAAPKPAPIHVEPPRPAPIAAEVARVEPPKPAPIHVEPPKPAPLAAEVVRVEPPKPAPIAAEVTRIEPPKPAPMAAEVTRIEPHKAPAQHTLPHDVPQMPRPSLVPGIATPTARAPEAVTAQTPALANLVRDVADRVPAAASAKGPEYDAISKLSREVIEQIVWEVVPELAETIIRQELDRLVRERQNA